ncbi:uncharacterized protein LOC141586208 [Silene latifolia]|uniref:uncharacterized protein LOC141586208 n=1 Tax=Silene latifolia TaxID=37657 RepID=UPI003D789A1B
MSTSQSISSSASKKTYADILQGTPIAATSSAAQSVGITTRRMVKKAAVNAAAASLRSAHVPTRPRKISVASIAAAATALLAASSPSHEEVRSVKVEKKASPCKSKASPKKKETSTPNVASVMVISGDTLEDRMQKMNDLLGKMMKENEEKNKKIDELQKEVVALRDRKADSEHDDTDKDVNSDKEVGEDDIGK